MTLQEAFSQIEDHRRGPAQRYDLKEMIVMAICAVLCGCDSWVDIADWCEEEEDWLKTFMVLANGTPSHDTFGKVFRVLDATVVNGVRKLLLKLDCQHCWGRRRRCGIGWQDREGIEGRAEYGAAYSQRVRHGTGRIAGAGRNDRQGQ